MGVSKQVGLPQRVRRHFAQGSVEQKEPWAFFQSEREGKGGREKGKSQETWYPVPDFLGRTELFRGL